MCGYSRLSFLVVLSLLVVTGCSDDGPPALGPTDSMPPTIAAVIPVDALHFDVTFSEPIRESRPNQWVSKFQLFEAVSAPGTGSLAAASPGDPLPISTAYLEPNQKTVSIVTALSMNGRPYNLTVVGVSDLHGNELARPLQALFTASNVPDTTPPQIVAQSPSPGAIDMPVNAGVRVKFSEPVEYAPGDITWTSQSGPVYVSRIDVGDPTEILLFGDAPLTHNELQHVAISGVNDMSGNSIVGANWSFRTTSDKVGPEVVSTSPYNSASNVNVNKSIVIACSKPLEFVSWSTEPHIDFDVEFANDTKTMTMYPYQPLLENQQYIITFYPGSIYDTHGNGNAKLQQTVFTTGRRLAGGSIAGTIMGDPGTASADPTGALIILYGNAAVTTVLADNTYSLPHLPDGTVQRVFAVFDTNRDNVYDTYNGDAWGTYGVDATKGDYDPDSVLIDNGSRAREINFGIVDPSVIAGNVDYRGAYAGTNHDVWAGLFHAPEYDAGRATPFWAESGGSDDYTFSFLLTDNPFPDGNYYVGAFIDMDGDGSYTPGVEPFGMYGGVSSPTLIHVANANDFRHIVIPLADPSTASQRNPATTTLRWPLHHMDRKIQSLMDTINAAAAKASRSSSHPLASSHVK